MHYAFYVFQLPYKKSFVTPKKPYKTFPEAKVWEKIDEFKTELESELINNNSTSTPVQTIDDFNIDTPEAPELEDESDFNDLINYNGDTHMPSSQKPKGASNNADDSDKRPSRPKTYRDHTNRLKPTGIKIDPFVAVEGNSQSDDAQLFLMSGSFLTLTEVNSFANDDFARISLRLQQVLQPDYRNDIANVVTDKRILQYIKALSESLQLYLFLVSVIEYCRGDINGNIGMFYIRDKINVDDLNDLQHLKDLLESYHVNPNFVKFLKKMYMNYSTNSAKYSPIIKFCPTDLFLETTNNKNYFISGKTIRNKISELKKYNFINYAFSQMYPKWSIDLKDFNSNKIFDSDFLTLWHNTAINYAIVKDKDAVASTRESVSDTADISLNVFSNSTKGEFIASISIHETVTNTYQSGIFIPSNDYPMIMDYEDRVSMHVYIKGKGIKGIHRSEDAVTSFNYITPYVTINAQGVQTRILHKSPYMAELKLHVNLNFFRKYVQQTMQYIFLP